MIWGIQKPTKSQNKANIVWMVRNTKSFYQGLSRFVCLWVVNWVPEPIAQPQGIRLHRITVIVSVPTIVSVCSVFYVKYRVTETRFSIGRISGLRLGHLVGQTLDVASISNGDVNWGIQI